MDTFSGRICALSLCAANITCNKSTDNIAIATVFGDGYKELVSTSQKQLLRFKTRANGYRFVARHIKGLDNPIADGLSRFTIELIKKDQQLPPEQQQYPSVALKAMISPNTNTPPMTNEEKQQFELAKLESQRLESKKNKLIKQAKYYHVNLITNGYDIDPQEIRVCDKDDRYGYPQIKQQYQQYQEIVTKSFNDTMRQYIDNSNYLERDRLREYIYTNCATICSTTDDTMGTQETRNLKEQFMNILSILQDIEINHCEQLSNDLQQQQWQDLVQLSLIHDQVYDNCIINVIDEPYDYRDDLSENEDIDLDIDDTHTIITRSKTRQQQQL